MPLRPAWNLRTPKSWSREFFEGLNATVLHSLCCCRHRLIHVHLSSYPHSQPSIPPTLLACYGSSLEVSQVHSESGKVGI